MSGLQQQRWRDVIPAPVGGFHQHPRSTQADYPHASAGEGTPSGVHARDCAHLPGLQCRLVRARPRSSRRSGSQRDRPRRGVSQLLVPAPALVRVAIARIVRTRGYCTIHEPTVQGPEAWAVRAIADMSHLVQERADDGSDSSPAGSVAILRAAHRDDRWLVGCEPGTAAVGALQAQSGLQDKHGRDVLGQDDRLEFGAQALQERGLRGRSGKVVQAWC